jgi:hypothetical protein
MALKEEHMKTFGENESVTSKFWRLRRESKPSGNLAWCHDCQPSLKEHKRCKTREHDTPTCRPEKALVIERRKRFCRAEGIRALPPAVLVIEFMSVRCLVGDGQVVLGSGTPVMLHARVAIRVPTVI